MQENNANLTKNQAQSTHKSSTILFIVSIKLGTKKRSVYYFSFMKLMVSTFLVYKVKKCLLKSGEVRLGSGKVTPKHCPILPEALGKVARQPRSHLFIVSVMLTHVRGHWYSCTRVWMLMYMSKHSHCGLMILVDHF